MIFSNLYLQVAAHSERFEMKERVKMLVTVPASRYVELPSSPSNDDPIEYARYQQWKFAVDKGRDFNAD